MLSEIRRMKLRNVLPRARFSQSGCCQDCQRSSQRSKKQWRCRRKPNTAEVTDTRRTKSMWYEKRPDCDSVEQHSSCQNPGAQSSIETETHRRSTSMSQTVSTSRSAGLQQIRTRVGRCPGHTSDVTSNVEKEISKYPTFLQKEIDTQELEQRQGSAHEQVSASSDNDETYHRADHRRFMRKLSRTALSLTSSFESWHSENSQQCSQHSQRRETRNR